MYFVADEGIISVDLPTRFTVSRSTIRNVVSLCGYYPVLPDFINQYIVPKNPCLTQRQLRIKAQQVDMDSDTSLAKFVGETLPAENVNKNTDILAIT